MTCRALSRSVVLFFAAGVHAQAGARAPAPDAPPSSAGARVTAKPAFAASAPWLQPTPATPGESALRAALGSGSASAADPLLQAAPLEPDSPAAGLARLAAAWLLVDGGRAAEALPLLAHPDVARTALSDYARFTLARALEDTGDRLAAAAAYRAAAEAAAGRPLACTALVRAAEASAAEQRADEAVAAYEASLGACRQPGARALLRMAEIRDAQRDGPAAAQAYDRLDREYPASSYARAASARRRALATLLPAQPEEERTAREARRALAYFDAGLYAEAEKALHAALARAPKGEEADRLRVRYGRALLARRRTAQGLAALRAVPPASAHAAEAAYAMARAAATTEARLGALEAVAARFRGTTWGEQALLALASHHQKDAHDAEALPYYRRLLQEYPEGRYTDRSAWRAGWGDFRAQRYEEAARAFEWAARARPVTSFTAGFLYWAARARAEMGERDRARQLYEETLQRFKHAYHGLRAAEALAELPGSGRPAPALVAQAVRPEDDVAEPHLTRLRQLLLIERLDEAVEELQALPAAPAVQATIAWLEWRRGRLRPAIDAMQRAFPGYLGSAADHLSDDVLRILYPIEFRDEIERAAGAARLDPALVAALIRQESTFEPGALSPAGARGLMQVMPATGRTLARELGVRYRRTALHDPQVSLDLGTAYLRRMIDRFGGRVDRALAAYNAGPHRVDAWTAGRPDASSEEFVESIPFTETRSYVMTVLAAREQYRRLYGLQPAPPALASGPLPEGLARP